VFNLGQIEENLPADTVVTNELIEAANNFDVERVKNDAAECVLSPEWEAVNTDNVPWPTD
jgi:hypothetical protein